jgi:hypothetical protein
MKKIMNKKPSFIMWIGIIIFYILYLIIKYVYPAYCTIPDLKTIINEFLLIAGGIYSIICFVFYFIEIGDGESEEYKKSLKWNVVSIISNFIDKRFENLKKINIWNHIKYFGLSLF